MHSQYVNLFLAIVEGYYCSNLGEANRYVQSGNSHGMEKDCNTEEPRCCDSSSLAGNEM